MKRMSSVFMRLCIIGICLILAAAVPGLAAEIHVPAGYPTIQSAINASIHGDVIVVHPGTYAENIRFWGKVITVRGMSPDDPAVVAATVIDGGSAGRVATFANGEGNGSVLRGLTLQGGEGGIYCSNASPTITQCVVCYNHADYGGGVYCIGASPVISYCTISHNWTSPEDGGGIFCAAGSAPAITHCTVSHNSSYGDGGGIYATASSPAVTHCTVTYNRAQYGGGIYSDGPLGIAESSVSHNLSFAEGGAILCLGTLTATNCTVSDNSSFVDGGGIHCGNASSITGCTVTGNDAARYGGGTYCNGTLAATGCTVENNASVDEGGGIYANGAVNIIDCRVSGNASFGSGGGIYCGDSSSVTTSVITGNDAYDGGGIYCYGFLSITGSTLSENTSYGDGGGIYCGDSSTITASSFINNTANQGGGVYCIGLLTMTNCALVGNSSYDRGGAAYSEGAFALTNCTITDNFAGQGGGVYYDAGQTQSTILNAILWNDAPDEIAGQGTEPAVSYSDIQDGYPGAVASIDEDPLFVDPGLGDYHLMVDSLCINAGTDQGAPIRDLDNNFRDWVPDMGAYEYINRAPQIDPIGSKSVKEGNTLRFTISATDPDGDSLTYGVGPLPAGAQFKPETRTFTWKPDYTQSGTYTVEFIATDTGIPPLSDSQKITITVVNLEQVWASWWYPQGYSLSSRLASQQSQWNLGVRSTSFFPQFKPTLSLLRYQNLYQPLRFHSYQPSPGNFTFRSSYQFPRRK